jgi:hypothetical protein
MTVIISGDNGVSDVDGSAGTPAIRGTDANTGIFFPAADTIAFAEGGTEAMRIDSSGNVGIGTTNPDLAKFQIGPATGFTTGNATTRLLTLGRAGQTDFVLRDTTSSTEARYRVDDGVVSTGAVTNHPLVFVTNATERARIDSSGRLLVGTTTAKALVTVNADIAQNSIPSAVGLDRYKQFFYENNSLADDHTAIVLGGSLTSGFTYYTCVIEVVVTNGDTTETSATLWVDSKETTVTSTNLGGINSTNIAVVNGTTGTDNKFNICCNSQNQSSYLAIRNRMGGTRQAYVVVRFISIR